MPLCGNGDPGVSGTNQGPKERKHALSKSETLLRMEKGNLVNKYRPFLKALRLCLIMERPWSQNSKLSSQCICEPSANLSLTHDATGPQSSASPLRWA